MAMLEQVHTGGKDGDRQWYHGTDTDLYIWRDPGGSIRGFQFCWSQAGAEYCVTGFGKNSVWLHRVDDGEASPWHNRAPVLRAAKNVPFPLGRLISAGTGLDPMTGKYLLHKLSSIPG